MEWEKSRRLKNSEVKVDTRERVCAMKRIIWGLLVVLIALTVMPAGVFALSGQPYEIEELDMKLEIPDEYVVFTRDTDANDPKFSQINMTKEDLTSWMEGANAYLVAFDEFMDFEINIMVEDSTLESFATISDSYLSAMGESIREEYESAGQTVTLTRLYQQDQTKFIQIFLDSADSMGQANCIQSYTVYNGKAINILFYCYDGRIEASEEARLLDILDSITFGDPPRTSTIPETEAFEYRESQSGVTFTVPANWSETPLENTRQILKAKFTSNVEGDTIMYGFMDLWNSGWSAEDKQGHERSEIDNSFLSDVEIAVYLGVDPKDVSKVTYGGYDYFKINTDTSELFYEGSGVTMDMTQLMRIENGYMYCFYFSGNSWNNSNYADFEALLETVEYPENHLGSSVSQSSEPAGMPEPTGTIASEQNRIDDNRQPTVSRQEREEDYMDRFRPERILVDLLITIAIYSLPVFIYRYAIRQRPVKRKTAKIITIVYGVVAFLIMSIIVFSISRSAISGSAVVIWSFVNYKMLISGAQEETEEPPKNLPRGDGPEGYPGGAEYSGEEKQASDSRENTQPEADRSGTKAEGQEEKTQEGYPPRESTQPMENQYNIGEYEKPATQDEPAVGQNTQPHHKNWDLQDMQDEYERMVKDCENTESDK